VCRPDEAAALRTAAFFATSIRVDELKLPQITIRRECASMIGFGDLYLRGVRLQEALRVRSDHRPCMLLVESRRPRSVCVWRTQEPSEWQCCCLGRLRNGAALK
jgi:hypothetical protein